MQLNFRGNLYNLLVVLLHAVRTAESCHANSNTHWASATFARIHRNPPAYGKQSALSTTDPELFGSLQLTHPPFATIKTQQASKSRCAMLARRATPLLIPLPSKPCSPSARAFFSATAAPRADFTHAVRCFPSIPDFQYLSAIPTSLALRHRDLGLFPVDSRLIN